MPRSKPSITRDSVFRSTGDAQAPKQGIQKQEIRTRQTAVWLADEETEWIDTRLQEIKKAGWRGVTRSAFIRSLIRATMNGRPVDVSGVTGEAELEQRLSLK
ncbi:MAG: hypothetical protein JO266_05180 [Acidobacteria bacterium]|nr:hypothetical protein [Acidobacteriota bacterium]